MSALDTVKELGRMATTATLTKDVIDLSKEKVALLTDQVAKLEKENAVLKTEKANFEKKVADLEQQIDRFRTREEGRGSVGDAVGRSAGLVARRRRRRESPSVHEGAVRLHATPGPFA